MARLEAVLRPVGPGDAEALAAVMRPEDAAEVHASHGLRPLEAIRQSLEASCAAFTGEIAGEVAAIFGVETGPRRSLLLPTDYDVIWLFTGRACAKHPGAFWRASKRVLGAFLDAHPVLANGIDASYAAALRWARELGAEVGPAAPWGKSGRLFHGVVWRRSSWVQRQA